MHRLLHHRKNSHKIPHLFFLQEFLTDTFSSIRTHNIPKWLIKEFWSSTHYLPIKIFIFIKIITKMKYTVPSDQIFLQSAHDSDIPHHKSSSPKDQICLWNDNRNFSVHITFCTDIWNSNLLKVSHQFLQCWCGHFCNIESANFLPPFYLSTIN